jgi:predicted methyltransferase
MKRTLLLLSALPLVLSACGEADDDRATEPMGTEVERSVDPAADADRADAEEMAGDSLTADAALRAAIDAEDRPSEERARDQYRNPAETIRFFGIEPSDTVVEIWPGGGWYTEILARYLAAGDGMLYAAGFDPEGASEGAQRSIDNFEQRFMERPEYGDVEMTVLSQNNQSIAPDGTADAVVTFRNVHNFQMGGWAPEAFAAFYEALKPGGVLGVVDHRLPEDADIAREQSSGYVKVSTVRQLAEDAGFVFEEASEINANPMDDTDHPFGVWTLPPNSRQTGRNGAVPEGFDPEEYRMIGESDRFTLRFRKPEDANQPEDALLE